ncbi:MAG: N-acetylneuraminate synthase [Alphaproteobacteria bacterium]|nr:N-acetylneuraminate synthase [Alphaproteobacteria bacterium]
MDGFPIGERHVGDGSRCFIIAEAGVNHDGKVEDAHRLVDAAAEAGADAVKFQTFDADALATADAPKAAYQVETTGAAESQRDMLKRLELPREAHAALKAHCEQRGLVFLSTPFDPGSIDFLVRLGVLAFKTPSQEIINLPYLRQIARYRRPMIVSTGNSTMAEVDIAVATIEAEQAPFALLHCVSQYPAAAAATNLRAMVTLKAAYGVPVGFSDHSVGTAIPIAAAALGAKIIEKHYTLDRSRAGPDHRASLEPGELASMVRDIRLVEAALGDGRKRPAPGEPELGRAARKSLVAARDLPAGTVLDAEAMAAKRPGTGISPALIDFVIGRRLRRPVAEGAIITLDVLG